jgi:hypothetical protein
MAIKRVIVELRVPRGLSAEAVLSLASHEIKAPGFEVDTDYQPVSVPLGAEPMAEAVSDNEEIMLVRGTIEEGQEEALKREPCVIAVWSDARIEPFDTEDEPSSSDLAF